MTLIIRFLHRIGSSITVDLMRAFAVVKFYVCPNTFSKFAFGTVVVAIKLFRFECLEKCFHDRVVVGILALIAAVILGMFNLKLSEKFNFSKKIWYVQIISAVVLLIPMIKLWEMLFDFLQKAF